MPGTDETRKPLATLTVSKARDSFAEIVNRVLAGERVVLTRHGHLICAIAPVADVLTEEEIAVVTQRELAAEAIE